jgi:hypothetical protein
MIRKWNADAAMAICIEANSSTYLVENRLAP